MADFSRLKSQLLQSGLQQTNPPLYQLINQLLDANVQQKAQTTAQIAENLTGLHLLTWANDLALVPLSRLVSAGTGILFDETTFGSLVISTSAGDLPLIISSNLVTPSNVCKFGGQSVEISDDIEVEIPDESEIELVGAANGNDLAYLELSIENATQVLNISTLGTIDWLVLNLATTLVATATSTHAKFKGPNWLLNSFKWCSPTSLGTFSSTTTISSTSGDDLAASAVLSSNVTAVLTTAATGLQGWVLHVPVLPNLQVLRIFAGCFGCDGNLTISFANGLKSLTYKLNTTNMAGNAASNNLLFKIAYWGTPCDMIISWTPTNLLNVAPNLTFIAAYIASL